MWSKQNSSAGFIQPTGCQRETSVLDNILMDEDNSFIACDHSSWEFPTGMNQILYFFFTIEKSLVNVFLVLMVLMYGFSPYDPHVKKNKM